MVTTHFKMTSFTALPDTDDVAQSNIDSGNDRCVDIPTRALHEQRTASGEWMDEFFSAVMETGAPEDLRRYTSVEVTSLQESTIEDLRDQEELSSTKEECLQGRHAASLAQALPEALICPPPPKRKRSTSSQSYCSLVFVDLVENHPVSVDSGSPVVSKAATQEENRCTSGEWLHEFYDQLLDINEKVAEAAPPQEEPEPVSYCSDEDLKCLQGRHARSLAQALPVVEKTPRKKRLVESDNIQFVDKTDSDILFGRGGESNHHVGNISYRAIIEEYRPHYKELTVKQDKTDMVKEVVAFIQHDLGGRFLEWDSLEQKWYVVHDREARRKVSQALRDKKKTPFSQSSLV